MYSHVFITWLIANAIHPVAIIAFGMIIPTPFSSGIYIPDALEIFTIMVVAPFYSLPFSAPILLVAMIIIWIVDSYLLKHG